MSVIGELFRFVKARRILNAITLRPFYFVRFIYFSFKEKSTWFYRYYPGYHGSTIPSLRSVLGHAGQIFSVKERPNDGIAMNAELQRTLLEDFAHYYNDFAPQSGPSAMSMYYYANEMYGFNDAFVLYGFLRRFRPAAVIEVGSGYSSALMLDTAKELRLETNFTFIDPYSVNIRKFLRKAPPGHYRWIREEVQGIALDAFSALQANDILFIDTSHVVKIGSDLSALLFEVIPSLKKGVIVHFHDIWYPWEYPEQMIREGRGYNEIYFVRAFLQFNNAFEIMYFNSFVEHSYKAFIEQAMPGFFKDSGKSLWIRKIT